MRLLKKRLISDLYYRKLKLKIGIIMTHTTGDDGEMLELNSKADPYSLSDLIIDLELKTIIVHNCNKIKKEEKHPTGCFSIMSLFNVFSRTCTMPLSLQ